MTRFFIKLWKAMRKRKALLQYLRKQHASSKSSSSTAASRVCTDIQDDSEEIEVEEIDRIYFERKIARSTVRVRKGDSAGCLAAAGGVPEGDLSSSNDSLSSSSSYKRRDGILCADKHSEKDEDSKDINCSSEMEDENSDENNYDVEDTTSSSNQSDELPLSSASNNDDKNDENYAEESESLSVSMESSSSYSEESFREYNVEGDSPKKGDEDGNEKENDGNNGLSRRNISHKRIQTRVVSSAEQNEEIGENELVISDSDDEHEKSVDRSEDRSPAQRKEVEVKNQTKRKQSTASSDCVIATSLKRTRRSDVKREKKLSSEGDDNANISSPKNECHNSHKEVLAKQKDDSSAGEETGEPTKRRRVAAARNEDILNTLLDSILEKSNSLDDEPNVEEQQPEKGGIPLKFRFDDEDEYLPKEEKSEFDLMVDGLFAESDYALKCAEMESSEFPEVEDEKKDEDSETETNQFILCRAGKHQHFFDEEIGIRCSFCKEVLIESKYVLPQLVNFTREGPVRTYHVDRNESSMFDAFEIAASVKNLPGSCNHIEGTVWDIMGGTRETMYAHQQEGFEFLWKNLMGTINLLELKNSDLNGVGGCIISHAPGTGKSRLTISFLESFLQIFPNSLPVIIAPASVLLTWEEEFKKWDVKFPFYNLNALKLVKNKDIARAMMLRDWINGRSILGVSYNLYEKLAGKKLTRENGKKKKVKAVFGKEDRKMRRILLELPDLVILDEGHTPRNQRSCIWNTIFKLKTEKRVILSGTPFQNNFEELFNTLRLVRPGTANALAEEEDFVNMINIRRRRHRRREGTFLPNSGGKVEEAIDRLKATIAPFVHVHKGSILKESLPGLRDCLILLSPLPMQQRLIDAIKVSKNTFESDHKVALISLHPSLVVHCGNLSNKEKSIIKPQQLKELMLKPDEGVKMRFLRKFVPLCLARNEKVLIFCQYKEPSNFIKEQLGKVLDGDVEKTVLQLEGKTSQRQRQKLIQVFNDPNSKAKVMIASTKCCSEGINLVGASRVVLLDVVWNPSVERQAICRAYRLGQTKVVHTYHLITCGTTEWEKYCRQAQKDRLSELVFSSSTCRKSLGKSNQFLNLEDIVLNDMTSQKKLEGMFKKIVHQPKEQTLLASFSSLVQ